MTAKHSGHPHQIACPPTTPTNSGSSKNSNPPKPPPPTPTPPAPARSSPSSPTKQKQSPSPLKHTDVKAHISAYIATVDVTQKYENPFDAKIEAVYVFPLPENAAINEFIMTIGDRSIRGIIRERKEAEQVYREARAQGHVASLLTQERANVFTQKVANIEPGKAIDINIKYLHTLAYDDGWYEYVFPMVVGPRYNPPNTTNGIDAVARGQAPNSNQSTAVEYLKPTERSGHDIALTLDIDAGVAVEQVRSMNHTIETKTDDANRTNVRLAALDSIPNKDFVLRYKVAGERVKSALLTHESDKGKYFSLMLFPPAEIASLPRAAMEMIFVIDCSGSMNGKPIEQAKAAVEYALKHLRADDTFQIVQFSSTASQFGASPVAANLENINKGVQYVRNLNGEGGTEMLNGIRAALDFPHDDNRLRFVSFLTDGFIGNESDILANIHAKLGSSRIFSFGVGSAPNRFLMDRMAVLGRGAAAYLSLNDNGGEVMDRFFAKISHPAMTDVALDFGGMQVEDVYPSRVPDLFVGRPIVVTGRLPRRRHAVHSGERPCRCGGTELLRQCRLERFRPARRPRGGLGADENRGVGRPVDLRRHERIAAGNHAARAGAQPDVELHRVCRGRFAQPDGGHRGNDRACAGSCSGRRQV
ncbi:MAG: VWA domain-containing protein [Planctomycetes bacterium]|nr:VWA domain-containing protein [Planctomycetota bacterium]